MHKFSRHEGVDEAIEWLEAERKRRDEEDNWQETEAIKALRTAISCLKALDATIDQAEKFANMHCNCH